MTRPDQADWGTQAGLELRENVPLDRSIWATETIRPVWGRGVSTSRKYYHAKKRSDETPQAYLYRLNLAAIRANNSIREGTPDMKREHFVQTLDDRDVAKQLILLRLIDADYIEETLCAYQHLEIRSNRAPMVSNKFRPRLGFNLDPTPSKPTRSVREIRLKESESSG